LKIPAFLVNKFSPSMFYFCNQKTRSSQLN